MARDDPQTASLSRSTRQTPARFRQVADPLLPWLTVLFHSDLERIGEVARLGGLAAGRSADISRKTPAFETVDGHLTGPLADPYVSRSPLILDAAGGGAVRLTPPAAATDVRVDGTRLDAARSFDADKLAQGVVIELAGRVVLLLHRRRLGGAHGAADLGLVGASMAIDEVRRDIARVAALDVPVLVRGETGTGKELVATALHAGGPRRRGPLVAVNLGAVTPSLAAAALFGSERGAFTGADRVRDGYFVEADGGTLFLDEIGEASGEVQPMLLRAVETGEITRIGGSRPRRVDVRLITATDADLEAMVRARRFRAPLLHRLAGFEIALAPLRERREDIGRLLVHFLRLERAGAAPWLTASLAARLARDPWPGNVRQMRNVVRQMVILSGRDGDAADLEGRVEALLAKARAGAPDTDDGVVETRGRRRGGWRPPSSVVPDELVAALEAHGYELKAAAAALGVSRPSLYALIEASPDVRTARQIDADEIQAAHTATGGDLDAMVERLHVSRAALRRRVRELGLAR